MQVLKATWESFCKKFNRTLPDVLRTGFDVVIDELKKKLALSAMKGDQTARILNAQQGEVLKKIESQLKAIQESDANLQHVVRNAEKAIQLLMDEELNVDVRLHQLEELLEFLREM